MNQTKQTIAVVGGTTGMGLATAQHLAESGHRVIISGRSEKSVQTALASLPKGTTGHPLDFGKPESIPIFFAKAGPLDHLALVGSTDAAWGPFEKLTDEALLAAFEGKFLAMVRCIRAALPTLRADGSILCVTGGAARSAIPQTSGVAAINGAIQAMCLTLAKELAPRRVNVLSPGLVDTPAYDWMKPQEKEAFFKQMGGNLPVGRVGRSEEIAAAAALLLLNPFTTGALLDVDGGGRLH
jgi:NAD(P)-dependent dehydrogenase (short-subunit alcohol dehydrogenase family)